MAAITSQFSMPDLATSVFGEAEGHQSSTYSPKFTITPLLPINDGQTSASTLVPLSKDTQHQIQEQLEEHHQLQKHSLSEEQHEQLALQLSQNDSPNLETVQAILLGTRPEVAAKEEPKTFIELQPIRKTTQPPKRSLADETPLKFSVSLTYFQTRMRKLYEKRESHDLSIKIDGKTIRAHKMLLFLFTDFFDHATDEIELHNVNFHVVEKLIQLLYLGVVSVEPKEVQLLLGSAKWLGITGIFIECDGKITTLPNDSEKPSPSHIEFEEEKVSRASNRQRKLGLIDLIINERFEKEGFEEGDDSSLLYDCDTDPESEMMPIKNGKKHDDTFPIEYEPEVKSQPKPKGDIETGSEIEKRRKNAAPAKIECEICGLMCQGKAHHLSHSRIHTGEKIFACRFCDKRFVHQASLIYHERLHTGEKMLKCQYCDKKFQNSGGLTVHERVHTKVKPLMCNACGKAFADSNNLKRHLRTHTGEKPYKCKFCVRAFSDRRDTIKHEKSVHNYNDPTLKCKWCDIWYADRRLTVKHEKKVHPDEMAKLKYEYSKM